MKQRSITRLAISLGIGGASVALYACSEAPLDPNTGGGLTGGATNSGGTAGAAAGTAGAGTSGSTAAGGSSGSGGSGTAGTVIIPTDASTDVMEDVEVTEDAACGTGSADASLQPVSMVVMFDRSTSMEEIADDDTGASRWNLASAALTAFFQDPTAADLGVALRFFPHDQPMVGCSADGCDADEDADMFDYPTATAACQQVLVDMGTLLADGAPTDAHEVALTNAITMSAPDLAQGTPIYAALGGALNWAKAYQLANPMQKTVVIFVTDGEANGCNTNPDDIAQLAADALTEANINTYAIGLTGASEADMNQLAEAGGTMMSYFIDDGATATADLLAALNAIRGMALSCDFPMPVATEAGMAIDPERVNVNYTASATGMETTFSKVTDASQCGTSASWYYDNPTAPTRIYLCPAACDAVKADADAKLDILVGCKTIIEPPK